MTDWLNLTIPFHNSDLPEKCERFQPISDDPSVANTCEAESFNQLTVIKCNEFVYEDEEVTILNAVRRSDCKTFVNVSTLNIHL